MSVIMSVNGGQWVAGEPAKECRAASEACTSAGSCPLPQGDTPATTTITGAASAPGQTSTVTVCTRFWADQGLILQTGLPGPWEGAGAACGLHR